MSRGSTGFGNHASPMCTHTELFFFHCYSLQQPEGERVLHPGRWSTDGCYQNLSNSTVTVCECNHLTHFAILLSARPLPDVLALQIIGYIGVSISLVAMAATIFVFVFLK